MVLPEEIARIHTTPTHPTCPPFGRSAQPPSGLLICWAWTQGSASAAQPRASWQNPVGIPGGEMGNVRPWGFPEGKRRSPRTSGVSMHIMGHRPHHFPAPNVNDVMPYSPGLRRSRRYPGFRPQRVPYPARGCAVRAGRGAISKGGMGPGSRVQMNGPPRRNCQDTPNPKTPHMPSVRSFGTTTFGVVDMLGMDPG